jgi:hypothetical protein
MAPEVNSTPQTLTSQNDTAVVRGVRTGFQTVIGTSFLFVVGLWLVIWNVPGVPVAVIAYVYNNLPATLLGIGLPTAVVSFIWNVLRSDVRNW